MDGVSVLRGSRIAGWLAGVFRVLSSAGIDCRASSRIWYICPLHLDNDACRF